MRLRVLLFAHMKQQAGTGEVEVELPDGAMVGELRTLLRERFPTLSQSIMTCGIAVDQEFVSDAVPIRNGAEVACIPPVSGG